MASHGTCAICGEYGRIARGWCLRHYARWQKYGDPLAGRDNASRTRIRALEINEEFARVPLTQGYWATIDLVDVDRVSQHNWHAVIDRQTVYAFTSIKCDDGKWCKVPLHAFIASAPDGAIVDHKDGDGLNNRRSNLRAATPSQNQWNKRLNRNNSSGYKGVRFANWASGSKKWRASLFTDGEHISLGYYETPEEAASAYDTAAKRFFGEYAKLNSDLMETGANG